MNNFRRRIPDNTNRHALILTHSLSRFTLPRCALYSDNPGLWDIQFSSWDFCESNAKVMSLIKSASSWFQGMTWTTRRLLRQQTSGHHALVTQRRFRQASHVTNTAHACAARFIAVTLTITDRQTDRQRFSLSVGCFPHEETQLDTYTHSITAVT